MITLRAATLNDLDAICRLESGFPKVDQLSRRSWRRFLSSNASAIVAQRDEQDIQACGLVLYRKGSKRSRLYSLIVSPDARGQGLARHVLRSLEAESIARNCTHLRLEVRATNAPAISLYEQAGYALRGEKSAFYGDGVTALVYEKAMHIQGLPST